MVTSNMTITNDNLLKKAFKSYLIVNILIVLAGTLGVLVDGIVIGQVLDQSSVSAYGLSGSAVTLVAAISGIFSTGSGAKIANYIGRGNESKIKLNFTITMLVCTALDIVVTVLMFFGDEVIAKLLGAKGELVPLAADYIKGLSVGMIPTMLSPVLMRYNRLDNHAKLSFLGVIAMTVCNIALDIIFGAVLEMGLWGMGLATSISYWVSALISCLHFLDKNSKFGFVSLKGAGKEIGVVLTTGIPSALNRGCVTCRKIVINWLLISLVGSIAVSAFSVQSTVNQFLMAVTMGMGLTTMDMSGIFYGEKNESALKRTLRVSIKTGFAINAVVCVLLFIFAPIVVRLFLNGSAEAMALAVHTLRWFSVSLPFSLVCVILIYFYQSTKNLFMANIVCVLHGLAFVLLISLALSPVIGAEAVWISFLCSEVLTLVTVVVVVRVKTGKWPKNLGELAMIPVGFTPEPEKVLDITVDNDMDKVMELSRRITEFCSKHTEDRVKINKLSLCIEEMAGNIVRHGFRDGKKHFIDIKIIMDEENITFRIRDDGTKFNPLKYADNAEAAEENMGIRIVREISKDMNYKYAVNMNNLTVII